MKLVAILAGTFFALSATPPEAYAQPADRDPAWRADRMQERELRREEEFRRRQQDRMGGEQGRHGRLTPEERQQLRRDIREHGRDVYRDRPHRF